MNISSKMFISYFIPGVNIVFYNRILEGPRANGAI